MKELEDQHRGAMTLVDRALAAGRTGDGQAAQGLFREAFEAERAVAEAIACDEALEPTRSVLLRSAATLALDCGDWREAERLVAVALSGSPREDIADELRDVLEQAHSQRHVQIRGARPASGLPQTRVRGEANEHASAHAGNHTCRVAVPPMSTPDLQPGRGSEPVGTRGRYGLDTPTVLGALGGLALLLVSVWLGGGTPLGLFSASSLLVVLGGSIASAMIAFPLEKVIASLGLMCRTFEAQPVPDPAALAEFLVSLKRKACREGVLAIEADLPDVPHDLLRRGLGLVLDGSDPQTLRDILETEVRLMHDRHVTGPVVLHYLGRQAPAFGVVGTLIGLMMLLYTLPSDAESIGHGMALTLVAALYGLVLSHLSFGPKASRLTLRAEQEMLAHQMIVEGVTSLQSAEGPDALQQRLRVFLRAGQLPHPVGQQG